MQQGQQSLSELIRLTPKKARFKACSSVLPSELCATASRLQMARSKLLHRNQPFSYNPHKTHSKAFADLASVLFAKFD